MLEDRWRKSTFSDTTNCLEVRQVGEEIWVRNSRDPEGSTLRYTRPEWRAFLMGARAGEFDDLT